MLVLGRKVGERCRMTIPGELLKSGRPLVMDIELTSLRESSARLGFDGPREIEVVRSEIADATASGKLGP